MSGGRTTIAFVSSDSCSISTVRSNNSSSANDSVVGGGKNSSTNNRDTGTYYQGRRVNTIGSATIPRPFDIICGRGSRVSSIPGNQRFQRFVEARRPEYQNAPRREDKSRIAMEVIQSLTYGVNPSRYGKCDYDTEPGVGK